MEKHHGGLNVLAKSILIIALCALDLTAQATSARPSVRAQGQASVFLPPDQVKIDASVVSQSTTAADAASQNATQVAALVASLQKLLGQNADIKTVNYSVFPVYKTPPGGGQSAIVGYNASTTLEVTLGSTSLAGAVIDAAVAGGATSIGSLQFSLKDPEPARAQALRMASVVAKNHADAMAAGLGHTTGAILSLQEGSTVTPVVVGVAGTAAAPTQITPGQIEVQGTVVIVVELN
jgi:uncharacterized protein YggE